MLKSAFTILFLVSVSLKSMGTEFQSKMLERSDSKNDIVLKFTIEECNPVFIKDHSGNEIEAYSNYWPCNLPAGKDFNSSRAKLGPTFIEKDYCPPSDTDIANLKEEWKCRYEAWRLTVRKDVNEKTFTVIYKRWPISQGSKT